MTIYSVHHNPNDYQSLWVIDRELIKRRELVFETVIPNAVRNGRVELRLVPQPRLEAVPLDIRFRASGWKIDGAASWQGPWDRVLTFTWDARRG